MKDSTEIKFIYLSRSLSLSLNLSLSRSQSWPAGVINGKVSTFEDAVRQTDDILREKGPWCLTRHGWAGAGAE